MELPRVPELGIILQHFCTVRYMYCCTMNSIVLDLVHTVLVPVLYSLLQLYYTKYGWIH